MRGLVFEAAWKKISLEAGMCRAELGHHHLGLVDQIEIVPISCSGGSLTDLARYIGGGRSGNKTREKNSRPENTGKKTASYV